MPELVFLAFYQHLNLRKLRAGLIKARVGDSGSNVSIPMILRFYIRSVGVLSIGYLL